MVEFFWWCSSYCSCYCQASIVLNRLEFLLKGGVTSLVIDDLSKVWLLINILYIASRGDLARISWNLRNRPIALLIFEWYFLCSTKFSWTSNVDLRCFWDILFFKGMSLNERQGWSSFLVFLQNITFCACLVKSGVKIVFHWKTQLLITVRSLFKVAALD